MAVIDLDIEAALREREDAVQSIRQQYQSKPAMPWQEKSFAPLRNAQVFVWEPNALEAIEEYFRRPAMEKRFRGLCFNGSNLRYIPSLLDTAFHCCPADGFHFNLQMVPANLSEPWTEILFRPTTRVIFLTKTTVDGVTYLPTMLGTTHLYPAKVRVTNWTEIERKIARLPRRDLMRSQLMQFTVETRFPVVRDTMIFNAAPLDWLEKLYQMRMFLEQPYVGATRVRARRPTGKARGDGSPEYMEVVKVSMREGLPKVVPRFVLPPVSRITGRPLEFEVEVKSHLRHCASGLVVPVKAHSRGPRGVKRERVIKIVR